VSDRNNEGQLEFFSVVFRQLRALASIGEAIWVSQQVVNAPNHLCENRRAKSGY
jgi:hypothetical protein